MRVLQATIIRKLYKPLLMSSVIAVGLAACGGGVVVTEDGNIKDGEGNNIVDPNSEQGINLATLLAGTQHAPYAVFSKDASSTDQSIVLNGNIVNTSRFENITINGQAPAIDDSGNFTFNLNREDIYDVKIETLNDGEVSYQLYDTDAEMESALVMQLPVDLISSQFSNEIPKVIDGLQDQFINGAPVFSIGTDANGNCPTGFCVDITISQLTFGDQDFDLDAGIDAQGDRLIKGVLSDIRFGYEFSINSGRAAAGSFTVSSLNINSALSLELDENTKKVAVSVADPEVIVGEITQEVNFDNPTIQQLLGGAINGIINESLVPVFKQQLSNYVKENLNFNTDLDQTAFNLDFALGDVTLKFGVSDFEQSDSSIVLKMGLTTEGLEGNDTFGTYYMPPEPLVLDSNKTSLNILENTLNRVMGFSLNINTDIPVPKEQLPTALFGGNGDVVANIVVNSPASLRRTDDNQGYTLVFEAISMDMRYLNTDANTQQSVAQTSVQVTAPADIQVKNGELTLSFGEPTADVIKPISIFSFPLSNQFVDQVIESLVAQQVATQLSEDFALPLPKEVAGYTLKILDVAPNLNSDGWLTAEIELEQ